MKHYIYTIIILLTPFVFSCTKDEVKQEDIALEAAKTYYEKLISGDYTAYVNGCVQNDSIPEDYKEQLVLNTQMYIEDQQKEHNGIAQIQAIKAKCDTITTKNATFITADAFLALCYNDSTREEIVVPMILRNNAWLMK